MLNEELSIARTESAVRIYNPVENLVRGLEMEHQQLRQQGGSEPMP